MISKSKTIFILTCSMLLLSACDSTKKYHEPSGKSAFVPNDTVEFSTYVRESQHNIEETLNAVRENHDKKSYLGEYTNHQAAKMRAPYQVQLEDRTQCNGVDKGNNKGFLLIHGLTDSPYLMRSMSASLSNEYPCSLIRAVLLPGHGTIVGDSVNMKSEDWKRIVKYGVNSFKSENRITDLYLVAFSTGTSLSIDYMRHNPTTSEKIRNDKIKGLVLLSVAVKAKSPFAFLSPFVGYLKDWVTVFNERDAARYESFSFNAGAQFYNLTKGMLDKEYALKVPVFMAVTADDATIDARAAREFFCYSKDIKRRALVWYQSIDQDINSKISKQDDLMCENIVEVKPGALNQKYKTVNLAHIAISMDPNDSHYGFNGKYHDCKKYDSVKTINDFNKCQSNNSNYVFGEKNVDQKDGTYIRRGTFNPDYENLAARITCFVNDNCPIEDMLKSSF